MKYLAIAATFIWAVIAAMNVAQCSSTAQDAQQDTSSSPPPTKQAAASEPQVADDGTLLMPLSASDRDHVRSEMRGFLVSLQSLTEAIAREDRAAIAEAAASMGTPHVEGFSATMKRTPREFRMMGQDLRASFRSLSAKAETAPMSEIIEDLSFNLGVCASCHATWRVVETDSQ